MKTKIFGKLIALALCVAMAFSMSSTAFAAAPSEGEYFNDDSGNSITIVSIDNTLTDDSAVAPIASHNITLEPRTGVLLTIGKLSSYQKFSVDLSWAFSEPNNGSTPSILMGIQEKSASGHQGYVFTGSSKYLSITVEYAGTYLLFLGNPSSLYDLEITYKVTV